MTQSISFAIVGPSNWNKLPHSLRDLFPVPSISSQAPENLPICQRRHWPG